MKNLILQEFEEHKEVAENTASKLSISIEMLAKVCIDSIKNEKKIIFFGNGGSAADSQHLAAELVGRYKEERRGLPAIALTTDTSSLTAIGNDYGYENVFSRQIEALAIDGDVVIGISTSGTSKNILKGLKQAKDKKCITVLFTGKKDHNYDYVDMNLSVPSTNTPRIQEMHITIGQIICGLIEKSLISDER